MVSLACRRVNRFRRHDLDRVRQFAITWLSVRSERFPFFVKAEPTLIVHWGAFLDSAMKQERITREEVLAVLRSNGVGQIGSADAVVLETDDSLSVLSNVKDQGSEARS